MEPQDQADVEPPDQHTAESRQALEKATEDLTAALQRHVHYATGMRGGSSELTRLHELNDEVERVAYAWTERVTDHTGTIPFLMLEPYEEDQDIVGEVLNDDDSLGGEGDVAVVSRWDLRITDPDALLHSGRQAHRQAHPTENEEDALAVVRSPVDALYALLYERGEPWWEFPGVDVINGARMFVRPDEPLVPVELDDLDTYIRRPPGEEVCSEGWA